MPLVIEDKENNLELLFRMVIDLVSLENLREFGKNLTPEQLEHVPDMADCDLGWVISCITSTVALEDVKLVAKRSRNPFTSAIAWTYGKDITFNTRKRHSLESVVKGSLHELCHIADHNDAHNFGHGTNFNQQDKQGCAPMLMGELFWQFIKKNTENSCIQLTSKR